MIQLFVLGDSISMQYGPYLERMVANDMSYARKQGTDNDNHSLGYPSGPNGGDSSMVLAYLCDKCADSTFSPDCLLLNCGLHDIKTDPETGARQVAPEQYAGNLQQIAEIVSDADLPLVWVRTTPIDDDQHNSSGREFVRYNRDVVEYNGIADGIIMQAGYPAIDLYTFTRGLDGEVFEDGVHFTERVRELHAAFIAGHLLGWVQEDED
jgi:hypothetical protein